MDTLNYTLAANKLKKFTDQFPLSFVRENFFGIDPFRSIGFDQFDIFDICRYATPCGNF